MDVPLAPPLWSASPARLLVPVRGGGVSDLRDLQRDARRGRTTRIRRGTYVDARELALLHPGQRHHVAVRAAARELRGAVFAGRSAAALWGLPLLNPWPDEVHVVTPLRSGGRSDGLVVRHGVEQLPDVEVREGIAATSATETLLTLARTESFVSALMAADAALRHGLTTRSALAAGLPGLAGRRGAVAAALVVAHADGRSGSPGESLSRGQMILLHLPPPELQHRFVDSDGLIGLTDFWWEDLRLIGEFDGRVKYGREVDDPRPANERVWAEKVREDRLRGQRTGVARWTWSIALDRDRLGRYLARFGLLPC